MHSSMNLPLINIYFHGQNILIYYKVQKGSNEVWMNFYKHIYV